MTQTTIITCPDCGNQHGSKANHNCRVRDYNTILGALKEYGETPQEEVHARKAIDALKRIAP